MLKNGGECYCKPQPDALIDSSNCNLKCKNDSQACGGFNQYSVYSSLHRLNSIEFQTFINNVFISVNQPKENLVGCFNGMELENKENQNITVDTDSPFSSCLLFCRKQFSREFAIKVLFNILLSFYTYFDCSEFFLNSNHLTWQVCYNG